MKKNPAQVPKTKRIAGPRGMSIVHLNGLASTR